MLSVGALAAWFLRRHPIHLANIAPAMLLPMMAFGLPLIVTELKPKSGFYDYDAKYTDGLTTHICPAQIPEDISDAMMGYALKAHRVLGCKGASRSDFRWDDQKGVEGIFLLEINTQPGMTPLSLVPEQAKHAGISYDDLVDRIVREAL